MKKIFSTIFAILFAVQVFAVANVFLGTIDANWGTAGNWSLLAVPTASDGNVATFTVASPNCTVNASARVCNGIDFTGYTNTITMTQALAVSGNITLAAAMTIAGAGTLTANATGTLTSNGKTWPNGLTLAGAVTFTIADNWTVGTFTNTINNSTINGSTIFVGGNFVWSNGSTAGSTTLFTLNGTGTWSGAGVCSNPVSFNTAGTITIGSVTFRGSSVTYVAGTMAMSGAFTINSTGTVIMNTSGMTWAGISITLLATITNNSPLVMSGTLVISGSGTTTINGSNWTIEGGYTASSGRNLAGTSKIIFGGSGTQNISFGNSSSIANDVDFNTSGTLNLVGAITALGYKTGTFTYIAGTVVITAGGDFEIQGSCTLNTAGIVWEDIDFSATATVTNNSLLTCTGTATLDGFNITFAGSSGWSFANVSTTTGDHVLKSGLTYTITTNITSVGTLANRGSFTSSIGGSQAILTLNYGATQDNGFLNATDINSSFGQTIWTYKGTLSNATNWNTLPVQPLTITTSN